MKRRETERNRWVKRGKARNRSKVGYGEKRTVRKIKE